MFRCAGGLCMERSKELLVGGERTVGTPLFEILEALSNAAINNRPGGKRNLPPLKFSFQQVTDFDAGLPTHACRNDHLVFVLDGNDGHRDEPCPVPRSGAWTSSFLIVPPFLPTPAPRANGACRLEPTRAHHPQPTTWAAPAPTGRNACVTGAGSRSIGWSVPGGCFSPASRGPRTSWSGSPEARPRRPPCGAGEKTSCPSQCGPSTPGRY